MDRDRFGPARNRRNLGGTPIPATAAPPSQRHLPPLVSPLSRGDLRLALARLGEDRTRRELLTATLRELEVGLERPGFDVREEVTGPLVDALHQNVDSLCRTLASGLEIRCHYRSKIARDFAMATPEHPNCVWEPQTTRLLLELSAEIEDAIIGGAYFGDHAIPVAHVMRAHGGRCHAFELDPDHIDMLRLNARQNGLDNLVIQPCGLWSEAGARLALVGTDSHAAPVPDAANGAPATSIDEYATQAGLRRIGLIQLDIEGGEFAALRGAQKYLTHSAEAAPTLVFEIHRLYQDWSRGLESTEIVSFVEGLGYEVFAIRDYQGNMPLPEGPVEVIPVRDAYLEGPPHGFNVLAVKNKRVLDRLPLRMVHGVSPKLLRHRDPKLHQPLPPV